MCEFVILSITSCVSQEKNGMGSASSATFHDASPLSSKWNSVLKCKSKAVKEMIRVKVKVRIQVNILAKVKVKALSLGLVLLILP